MAGPEHRISVHEALKAVTLGAAYSWRAEHRIGSITVGKDATFTVLDGDPYPVGPAQINRIGVVGVMRQGRWLPVRKQASHARVRT